MKRPLSLLLACTLALSLCPAAWGADLPTDRGEEPEKIGTICPPVDPDREPGPGEAEEFLLAMKGEMAPAWVSAGEYLIFPGDPVYGEENWARVLELRGEAQGGALLPEEGRDWAQGSPGQCYETALLRLKYAENTLQAGDEEGAKAAFLSAGKAFEAAESAWYDQGGGRDETYYRLRVEKYRAYLLYHPQYIDNWGRALVPALDALGLTLDDFFAAPYMDRVSAETREMVIQSADAYWSFYLPEKSRITVYVDGVLLQTDTPPQVREERTMVPVRALAEALGAHVEWDPDTWKVTMTRAGSTVSMTPGEATAWVDGEPVEMDVVPYADQNRTYFPVRYVAEFFGQQVSWTAAQRRVDVTEDKSAWTGEDLEPQLLPMGALLGFLEGGDPARFGFYARPGYTEQGLGTERRVEPVTLCRTILAENWQVSDRESLQETVEEILAEGHNKEFRAAADEVKDMADWTIRRWTQDMEELDRQLWLETRALWKKWGEKGIRAWDLCRAAALAEWGYTAGYLTYAEALELSRPAALELAQTFESWDQVYENFLEGYYWCARVDLGEKTVWDTDLGMGYLYLKNSPETRTLFNDEVLEEEAAGS